jgi:outer membrane protein
MGLWFAATLTAALPGLSGDLPIYTLEECIGIGLENNAEVRKARRDQEIGEALRSRARSEALPQLSLDGSYTRMDELQTISLGTSGQTGADSAVEVGALDNYRVSGEVSQLLYSGGRVRAALQAAGSSREYYNWSAEESEDALVRDIRSGFHALLFARDAVRVREESVSNLTVHVEQAEQKYRIGTASEFDLISARVRLANEKPALIAARNAQALALADLRRLLGREQEAFQVAGALAFASLQYEVDELQELALESRPALRRMATQVRLRELDASAAASGYWPALRSFFNYAEANPYGFTAAGGEWEGHWTAGLTLEWSLWDGGLTRATVREKRLETEKARIDLENMRSIVQLEVEQALLSMTHAAEAVAAGGGNVEQAERAMEIAGNRYASGLGTQLEYTDSALALSVARLSRIEALRSYMDAVARLQFACGPKDRDLYQEMRDNQE